MIAINVYIDKWSKKQGICAIMDVFENRKLPCASLCIQAVEKM